MTLSVEHVGLDALTGCLLFVLPRLDGTPSTRSHHALRSMVTTKSCSAFSSIPECGVFPDSTFFDEELPMPITRLQDQANSTHRLAIWRGMWIPWASRKCAAFHWVAWLPAHFFSLWFLPSHSPFFLPCYLVILCCPSFPIFSCGMIWIFFISFLAPNFVCYWLLCPAFPSTV